MRFTSLTKLTAGAAITGSLGLGALGLGLGAGTASADPGPHGCWAPYCQGPGDGWRYDGDGNSQGDGQWVDWNHRDWSQRNIDDARFDHQPFNWQGQRVEPFFDNGRGAWGFWFFGMFIPL